jgi:OFA family oxalate/formate antiporter-like MFS transporter
LLSTNGSWSTVFICAAVVSIAAAVSAKFVLAPMRRRWIGNTAAASQIAEGLFQPLPNGSHE